jgi:peptidoglycan biosynthesis protein MviN/MurJ (putative lipid II flippase)
MYLRAGVFSLGLLLLSRALGLLRESAQAAAFGSTGMGDAVIVMFTLPDLLVGILVSGALSYVLLPVWAQQSVGAQAAGQRRIAYALTLGGLAMGLLIWLFRDAVVQALAPGLTGDMKVASAGALGWSALVLPLAMLAALWVTRLQHERDFVGMYAGNLIVNLALVIGLFVVAKSSLTDAPSSTSALRLLGFCLVIAMLGRLAWLAWRLPGRPHPMAMTEAAPLPAASVWLWAALSSGLLLVFPLMARSLASSAGEGALASFNYAWKLIELPLVLAVQLVASLAFPAITRTAAGSPARQKAVGLAFLIAWTLACAAIAVVATFSLPIANLLFGWGRMSAASLAVIAQWSAIGIWSLLPQALTAVLLIVMATHRRMHAAVWVLSAGSAVLLAVGMGGNVNGAGVMWLLNGVFGCMAALLMLLEQRNIKVEFPFLAGLVPLLVCVSLVSLKPLVAGLSITLTLIACAGYSAIVVGSAVAASPVLRQLLREKLDKKPVVAIN